MFKLAVFPVGLKPITKLDDFICCLYSKLAINLLNDTTWDYEKNVLEKQFFLIQL